MFYKLCKAMNKLNYFLLALGSSIVAFFFFSIPTAVLSNPYFTRMTPVSVFDWAVLIVTSILLGAYVGMHYYKKSSINAQNTKATCSAAGGAFLGPLSYGCAICNKILVLLLGFVGVTTYFVPLQPYLGVLSIGFLLYGIFVLWKHS